MIKRVCIVEGCRNWATRPDDLCGKHWMRMQRHGSTDQTRPKDWGSREKHPLYNAWTWRRRERINTICDAWRNDFWLFVSDVGESPGKDFFFIELIRRRFLGLVILIGWRRELLRIRLRQRKCMPVGTNVSIVNQNMDSEHLETSILKNSLVSLLMYTRQFLNTKKAFVLFAEKPKR